MLVFRLVRTRRSRMRWPVVLLFLLCTIGKSLVAQELFTYSEPASNMAAKSIGVRLSSYLLRDKTDGLFKYQLNPELMWGISKKMMVHAEALTGADGRSYKVRGLSFYSKYRFYSNDDVHKHFRMALYGRGSLNTAKINQEAIDLQMFHSGYELGWVGTELIQKWAFSLGFSSVKSFSFQDNQSLPGRDFGWNYNLSMGKLIFPLSYENYSQTNLNLMAEFPGQYLPAAGKAYIDAAPSLQLIFASKARLDFGYRFPLVDDLYRTMDRGFLLRFEYNFFNAIK